MSKVEQNHPAQPLSSWAAERVGECTLDQQCFGFSKREAVFLEFMSKLISSPDEFNGTPINKSEKAKVYTKQYFKTLEEWNNE